MALSKEKIAEIREELDSAARPLFFFHDDPDGLCSFLLFYRYVREGKGVPIKSTPKIDEKFLNKVEEFDPDKIFVLDIAMVDQDFIDEAKKKIVWIDHHSPLKRHNIKYFNPRIDNPEDNTPVCYTCYQVTEKDLWIAAIGCVGDWFFPDIMADFSKKYPDLLPDDIKKPEDALFNSRLGELVHILSFILKGKTTEVLKCIKVLTRIEDPYEIIDQTTSQGKFIFKRAEKIGKEFDDLYNSAKSSVTDDNIIVFTYANKKFSFTKEIANRLLYEHPDKKLIIGRIQNGDVKCSLRSTDVVLPPVLEKAFIGIEGYGGGHEHACGACIKQEDFDQFVKNFRRELDV